MMNFFEAAPTWCDIEIFSFCLSLFFLSGFVSFFFFFLAPFPLTVISRIVQSAKRRRPTSQRKSRNNLGPKRKKEEEPSPREMERIAIGALLARKAVAPLVMITRRVAIEVATITSNKVARRALHLSLLMLPSKSLPALRNQTHGLRLPKRPGTLQNQKSNKERHQVQLLRALLTRLMS